MKNRYYVQPLSEQAFIIRERISVQKGPGPNDRVIQSFTIRHDAYTYAHQMNATTVNPSIEASKVEQPQSEAALLAAQF
ncbi:hypothetical protein KDA_35300 [Dictyobacter alpinus]|uniref:Uncharacterized protein n=1 Tax=Dictyobacter alpinus TaxID=2014873 RepID=A0A402B9N8_9CHLR|nr:hypothetical protein [Dictyobacter alpinus]GCE28046.1 hypothetical protein KDA_35300 [Dictyobacter alpinus]